MYQAMPAIYFHCGGYSNAKRKQESEQSAEPEDQSESAEQQEFSEQSAEPEDQ